MIDKILSSDAEMELQFNNDIYSQFLCKFPEEINLVKNTLIYPAAEKHLNKYSAQGIYLVTETPDIYQKVTLPFIQEQAVHLQVKFIANAVFFMFHTQYNLWFVGKKVNFAIRFPNIYQSLD